MATQPTAEELWRALLRHLQTGTLRRLMALQCSIRVSGYPWMAFSPSL